MGQSGAHNPEAAAATPPLPSDWIPGLIQNWRSDLLSGFVIFLIALPLSLGIAIASGAPPMAGIITAIVGGMLVSLLSGSYVTINGPAAGLIVIVLGAIETLGDGDPLAGYRYALAVGVACGVIQIVLGLLKAGKLTNFFPLSVVHGMLAGIGIIIMSRQFHVAVGAGTPQGHVVPEDFFAFHALNQGLLGIPESIGKLDVTVTVIALAAMAIMVLWPRLGKIARFVPAALVAAISGVVLAIALQLDPKFMLNLPEGGLLGAITFPDFSKLPASASLIFAYVFVASLESLLTASAIDKLDPYRRRSNMNREFLGKGIGNVVSSMLGGLPMIAEVVRSSANVMNNGKTRWSNFFHGAFMLLAVLAIPFVLELIPLASLAGILIVIGFRLAHPKQFVHALHIGKEEFLFMIVTTVLVVAEDLLVGVIAGIVVGLIVAVVRGTSLGNLFRARTRVVPEGERVTVAFSGSLGFPSFIGVRGTLDKLPVGKTVVLDFSEVNFVDHTVVERLEDFENEYERDGGHIERRGLEGLRPSTHSPVSSLSRA